MSARQSEATKWAKEKEDLVDEARLLDLRRQAQIANQVDIINRLLEGETFSEVQRSQVAQIGTLTVALNEAKAEIAALRAELKAR